MFISEQQQKYSHIFNKREFKAERFADTWTSSSGSAPVSHRCGAAALQARFCFRTDALLRIWGSRMAYSTCDLVKILAHSWLCNSALSLTLRILRVRVQDCGVVHVLLTHLTFSVVLMKL